MQSAKVKKEFANQFLQQLLSNKLLNEERKILQENNFVIFPLKELPKEIKSRDKIETHDKEVNGNAKILKEIIEKHNAEIIEKEFPFRNLQKVPFENIKENLKIPSELKKFLPYKWELIGKVLILKIPNELEYYEEDVAKVYAEILKAETVVKEIGKIEGIFREPNVKIIFGNKTETIHKENNIKFKLDVAKIMFSSGNIDERIKMAKINCKDEIIVDMFAGIGYFSLPLAVYQNPKKIISCEINTIAYKYLKENIKLNNVNCIIPFFGDNRNCEEGIADRVIMGYFSNEEFLQKAMRILREKGIIHYHAKCSKPFSNVFRKIEKVAEKMDREVKMNEIRKIKSYSPKVYHVVVEFEVS